SKRGTGNEARKLARVKDYGSARIVVQMRRSSVMSRGPTPTLEESHVKGTSCRSIPGEHGVQFGPRPPGSVQRRAYEANRRDDCQYDRSRQAEGSDGGARSIESGDESRQ